MPSPHVTRAVVSTTAAGTALAVDMRATAPNWPTFSDERDRERVSRVRRNRSAGRTGRGRRRDCRCCE